jgi:hypothetical protein
MLDVASGNHSKRAQTSNIGGITGHSQTRGCVTLWPCHLHFKGILRQKKNYENSKYFTMQKYNLPKIL